MVQILYPVVCEIWKLAVLSGKIFPQNGQKLEVVENKIQDISIQCLVFNKTIIPLRLVGYELIILFGRSCFF